MFRHALHIAQARSMVLRGFLLVVSLGKGVITRVFSQTGEFGPSRVRGIIPFSVATSRVFRSLIRSTEFCNYLSKVGLRVPTVSLGRHEAASCVEGWTTPMVTTLLIGIILAFGATGSQAAPNTGGQQAPPIGNETSKDSPQTSESSSPPKEPKSGENGFAEFLKPKED